MTGVAAPHASVEHPRTPRLIRSHAHLKKSRLLEQLPTVLHGTLAWSTQKSSPFMRATFSLPNTTLAIRPMRATQFVADLTIIVLGFVFVPLGALRHLDESFDLLAAWDVALALMVATFIISVYRYQLIRFPEANRRAVAFGVTVMLAAPSVWLAAGSSGPYSALLLAWVIGAGGVLLCLTNRPRPQGQPTRKAPPDGLQAEGRYIESFDEPEPFGTRQFGTKNSRQVNLTAPYSGLPNTAWTSNVTYESVAASIHPGGQPTSHAGGWNAPRTGPSPVGLINHIGDVNPGETVGRLTAIALLPVATLLIAVLGLAIVASDGGPIIYRQRRVGRRETPFICYKLRTMTMGADSKGPKYTITADPRVTRVGRILRRLRLDEIPQILNIARGDMSWIGPRPEEESLASHYKSRIPDYSKRFSVKPGITGWAAIMQGNVGGVDAARIKLAHDLFYLQHRSIGLDLLILAHTIHTIIRGPGSI